VRSEKRGVIIALATVGITVCWLALAATGESFKVVQAIRGFLPGWFPVVNVFLVPLLLAVAGFPRTPPLATFLLYGAALCFGSALYLSYLEHPVATLVAVAVVYLEAYWLLPRWRRGTRGSG